MIKCTCTVPYCFFTVNYYKPITIEQVKKNPPFANIPLLEGEHEHQWEITEIEIVR